ncbi:MAG: hypothetical protein WCY09_08645 [Candidatus Omnitrophota bacterium]|jgi:hypothetical protein
MNPVFQTDISNLRANFDHIMKALPTTGGNVLNAIALEVARSFYNYAVAHSPIGEARDKRYGGSHLKDSFSIESGVGTYSVWTSQPEKLGYVTSKTAAHYMIFPGAITGKGSARALSWPGLEHPVKWVGEPYTMRHPGSAANPFIDEAYVEAERTAGQLMAQYIAAFENPAFYSKAGQFTYTPSGRGSKWRGAGGRFVSIRKMT